MEEIDLEVLYYIVPEVYRNKLDGEDDPNSSSIIQSEIKIGKYLYSCSLEHYIQTIMTSFLEKYPNTVALDVSMSVPYYPGGSGDNSPHRKENDIQETQFNYKLIEENNEDNEEEYLDNLKIVFKASQPKLFDWVEKALDGKTFEKSTENAVVIYEVSQSPILKIEVKEKKELVIFIDKGSYVRYYSL